MNFLEDDLGSFDDPTETRRNMANLFGGTESTNETSFEYTRPTQTQSRKGGKKNDSQTSSSAGGKLDVIHFATVKLFQLDAATKAYKQSGRVGACVLGNKTKGKFQLLLYYDNERRVCLVNISPEFKWTLQNRSGNTYASFSDEQGQHYSLLFSSEAEADDFSRHIAIARCFSSSDPNLTIQDLSSDLED